MAELEYGSLSEDEENDEANFSISSYEIDHHRLDRGPASYITEKQAIAKARKIACKNIMYAGVNNTLYENIVNYQHLLYDSRRRHIDNSDYETDDDDDMAAIRARLAAAEAKMKTRCNDTTIYYGKEANNKLSSLGILDRLPPVVCVISIERYLPVIFTVHSTYW